MAESYRIKSNSNIIISGIARKYIIEYFEEISGYKEGDIYYGPKNTWNVHVGPELQKSKLYIGLTTTILTFAGEPESVEVAMHLYRMKFISAGG